MKQVTLYCVIILIFAGCISGKKEKDASAEQQASFPPPVIVLIDSAKRVDLRNVPAPKEVFVPKVPGGFNTIQAGNEVERIPLKPPVVESAKPPKANFTNFNTDQGLPSNGISCGMLDHNGQLWFSAGNYVSRYDGSRFSNFSVGQGTLISSMTEDKKGNIWFASWGGGVYRYDGIRFKHFTTREGLANDMVARVMTDKAGNLWFSTYGGGVSRFDGSHFTNFNTSNGLPCNEVNTVAEDKNGNIWIGTLLHGVCRFDGSRFKTFTKQNGLAHSTVYSICCDKTGVLWFGTQDGVSRFDPNAEGKGFTTLNLGNELHSTNFNVIGEDKTGDLWFCTIGGGICRYHPNQTDAKKPEAEMTIFTTEQGLIDNNIGSFTEDKTGHLWFGTGGGLSRYNGESFKTFSPKEGLRPNGALTIAEDKLGNLWFGSYGSGMTCFDGKNFTAYTTSQGLPDNQVNYIFPDKMRNLWISTAVGLSRFNGQSFTTFTSTQGMVYSAVNQIIEDKNGNIWMTTQEGISRFDGTGFTSYTKAQGLSNNNVTGVAEGPDGDLWFATEGGGVNRFNGKAFINYTVKQGLAHDVVRSIIKDRSGNLWFGTLGGISRFDGSTFISFNSSQGLADNVVADMVEDGEGTIWFGTDKGFSGLKFKRTMPDNKSGEILGAGLLKDNNEQLKSYEPIWETFNNQTGYPVKDLRERGMCITKLGFPFSNKKETGIIWTGCNDENVIRFDPKSVTRSSEKPHPYFQSIKINESELNWYSLGQTQKDSGLVAQQESMVYGKRLPVVVADSLTEKFRDIRFDSITPYYPIPLHLILPYRHNRLTIDFGAIETNRNFMVRYQYILDGYDKEWSPVTEKASATFGNISEGNYIFKLKARSPEGLWSEPIEYRFSVMPPWWRSWWAYAVYIILIASAIYAVIRWRTRKLQLEKLRLEEKVNQRTQQLAHKSSELEQSLENLKSTQKQLIQSEKMASLGELTAGIAHEIQNPLNFVNNFSEVNKELLIEMKGEMDKGNLDEIRAIADDIIVNEEKINHHGKRADAIVKGMLEHSRTGRGQRSSTDINTLVNEYLRLAYQGQVAKDNSFYVKLQTNFDSNCGKINVIPQDIGKVMLNLYNNAFYALSARALATADSRHEPTVWVSTKRVGDKIFISVKDNGPGIPAKIVDKIFQPFFTTKPAGQGTGLGLSLSYDIVKAHGGDIRVVTTEAGGSEFIIEVPMKGIAIQ